MNIASINILYVHSLYIVYAGPKVISSLSESAPELAGSDNTSQYVFWLAIFFFAIQLHKLQYFIQ